MNEEAQVARKLLHGMKRIRMVEEAIAEHYPEGKIRCPTHLSIGQEAAAVGICSALECSDLAVSTHRAHAHYLAKGGDLNALILELHGKAGGCSRGRGGSMHLVDTKVGFMGSTAIVGNSIPIGVGLALSLQLKHFHALSVVFLGDGAVEEGVFYESVNFAAVRRLPVLFVCENNLYSVYSPLHVRQPRGRQIHRMVEAIGVPSALIDGNDVDAIYDCVKSKVTAIRKSEGPFFVELPTYRWREHCGPNYDNDIGYRTEAEFLMWKARDPVRCYERKLIEAGILNERELEEMASAIRQEIDKAFACAEQAPFPEPDEAFQGLFAA